MNRRRRVELMVGTGLLLGPLVYALTLPQPAAAPACEASEPAVEIALSVEVCAEPPAPAKPEPAEPEPEPERAPPIPASSDPAPFLFVHEGRVVLDGHADPSWATGPLVGEDTNAHSLTVVSKAVELDALPAPLRIRSQRAYELYDAAGRRCTTRLSEVRIVQQWVGWGEDLALTVDGPAADLEAVSEAERQQMVWDHAGAAWLVTDIEAECPADFAAVWARDAELPAVPVLHRDAAPSPETRAVIGQFRRSAQFAELRASYVDWYAALDDEDRRYEDPWLEHASAYPPRTQTWRDSRDRVRLVEFEFGADYESCGYGFDSWTGAVYEFDGGEAVPSSVGLDAIAAADIDLDGEFEFVYREIDHVFGHHELRLHSDDETLAATIEIHGDFTCPC